jgi:multidrug efflux pump subunit AcrA (membrane-fusion protein)
MEFFFYKNIKNIAVIIALVFFLAGCGSDAKKDQSGQQKQGGGPAGAGAPTEGAVFAVNTTTAVEGQIQDYLPLSGDIIPGSSVDVYSDVAGKITRLYVSVGDRVTRNQAIAAVDPSKPGLDYVPGITRAPITGTIVSLPAELGMTVSQAVPLARVAGGSGLEIRVYVAERYISKMAVSQPCEITLDAYPGEVFRGSVRELSPIVDTSSRTMELRINVENPGSRLKSGMFAKVRIITEKKDGIVKIPAGAMVQRLGENYVFSVDRNSSGETVARRKVVVPGILVDGVLEITSGLSPNEEIIVKGQTLLDDGAKINVIDKVKPLSSNS